MLDLQKSQSVLLKILSEPRLHMWGALETGRLLVDCTEAHGPHFVADSISIGLQPSDVWKSSCITFPAVSNCS